MTLDTAFLIVNNALMPFWLLLAVAPYAALTYRLVHSGLVPVIYGIIYVVLILPSFWLGAPEGASFFSLEGLGLAFSDPVAMFGGWAHYLVFDLFIGAWQMRDARRNDIPHLVMIIPLIVTLMAGPAGLLIYVAMKYFWKKRFTLDEAAPA